MKFNLIKAIDVWVRSTGFTHGYGTSKVVNLKIYPDGVVKTNNDLTIPSWLLNEEFDKSDSAESIYSDIKTVAGKTPYRYIEDYNRYLKVVNETPVPVEVDPRIRQMKIETTENDIEFLTNRIKNIVKDLNDNWDISSVDTIGRLSVRLNNHKAELCRLEAGNRVQIESYEQRKARLDLLLENWKKFCKACNRLNLSPKSTPQGYQLVVWDSMDTGTEHLSTNVNDVPGTLVVPSDSCM